MASDKRLELIKNILIISTLTIVMFKMIMSTLTTQDVLGLLPILVVLQAARVIDYKYPKRPDLFSQVEELQNKQKEILNKLEDIDHDMTGVKFGLKTRS